MPKILAVGAAVAGVLLVVAGVVYLMQPASSLPTFLPGYQPGNADHHFKHAIAATLLGLAAFAFAWFSSKPAKAG
jgi:hypothetical protein